MQVGAPIEAIAWIQRLRDDSAGHGCSAVWRDGGRSSWCSDAHGHVLVGLGAPPFRVLDYYKVQRSAEFKAQRSRRLLLVLDTKVPKGKAGRRH